MCSLKCLLDIKMEMSSRLEVNISRDFGERFKLEILESEDLSLSRWD